MGPDDSVRGERGCSPPGPFYTVTPPQGHHYPQSEDVSAELEREKCTQFWTFQF